MNAVALGRSSSSSLGQVRFFGWHVSTPASSGIYTPSSSDFLSLFYKLLRRWQSETAFLSDPRKIVDHPDYKALAENAKWVLPHILAEIEKGPSLLVWVLDDAFPNERPYRREDAGDIEAMTNAWLMWGERNGYLL